MKPLKPMWVVVISLFAFGGTSPSGWAHRGHVHQAAPSPAPSPDASSKKSDLENDKLVIERIDQDYTESVKPIFEKKCAACHGGPTRFPWYYAIPGVRHLIDSDVAEGKEHIDVSKGFPFGGHGKSLEDLDAINGVVKDRSMPPLRYWIMHPSSRLNAQDQKAIQDWIERARKLLRGESNR